MIIADSLYFLGAIETCTAILVNAEDMKYSVVREQRNKGLML